jgi:7,8-dihydropterin-6-yl-methyl-4-(beta-D-ribofuranosyl)aminobenzene 5'-phosphate synthase
MRGVSDQDIPNFSRRDVCGGGSAAALGALIATATGRARPLRAEPIHGPVPEVDRLSVRVVVDSYQLAIAPAFELNGMKVERFGFNLKPDQPPRFSLLSEFGLSLHLESRIDRDTKNILVDFGFSPEAFVNNLDILGIAPETLDGLVLSHGHFDHYGGLVGFLEQKGDQLPPKLPFVFGGEECFCSREWTLGGKVSDFGHLDRGAITRSPLLPVVAEGPSIVAGHAFTTGQIATRSFEKVLAPSRMTIGEKDGVGCFADKMPEGKRTAVQIPDDFSHELATCFNVKDRGLVVVTSCGHRGVVNSVKRAMEVSGVEKLHAVLGGFHLAPHPEPYVHETVLALKDLKPDVIIPMHCTGEVFHDIMAKEMPDRLVRSYTGSRYTFGA